MTALQLRFLDLSGPPLRMGFSAATVTHLEPPPPVPDPIPIRSVQASQRLVIKYRLIYQMFFHFLRAEKKSSS